MMAPHMEQLASEFEGKMLVAKVDCGFHDKKFAIAQGIKALPTFHIYHRGVKLGEITGGLLCSTGLQWRLAVQACITEAYVKHSPVHACCCLLPVSVHSTTRARVWLCLRSLCVSPSHLERGWRQGSCLCLTSEAVHCILSSRQNRAAVCESLLA